MTREFHIAREISREEVDRHVDRRLIGITASAPRYQDFNGVQEFVVDVRIGRVENQGLVKEVPVSQWALGVVTDINIPVLLERSEGGQLTVIGRSMIRLPDVRLTGYSFGALGIPFAANRIQQGDGTWADGFGFPSTDPNAEIVVTTDWVWNQGETTLEVIGGELVETTTAGWVLS
jgi:hypothetical protein